MIATLPNGTRIKLGGQQFRIFDLLNTNFGHRVGLPEILRLGVAQFGARILELRAKLRPLGYDIINETERSNPITHSWYTLIAITGQGRLFPKPELEEDQYEHSLEVLGRRI